MSRWGPEEPSPTIGGVDDHHLAIDADLGLEDDGDFTSPDVDPDVVVAMQELAVAEKRRAILRRKQRRADTCARTDSL